MGKSKNANKTLTQEEIWDDSALVQSWDEAVEEYKLYHSIHAKGENVEDVLREAEAAAHPDILEDIQADLAEDHADQPLHSSAAVAVPPTQQTPQVDAAQATERSDIPSALPTAGSQTLGSSPTAAGLPQGALSQVQDEGLKNLMMAWYFAGYYTGLYEGQQRAQNKN
ncbi:hypothetical protein BDV25DRAFT_165022 [Aspergillus avenaceus]|uniref:Survival Motor Neuron Gemin2-binding domain-containing protein n=1 Tax=Aspergillus avenaceus TaxID=36643 RepID=A0A5N6TGR3_ASPAV|nr:hypothetical protein BDV25DRAFT_165022 [Aspergillus avenaceus]